MIHYNNIYNVHYLGVATQCFEEKYNAIKYYKISIPLSMQNHIFIVNF